VKFSHDAELTLLGTRLHEFRLLLENAIQSGPGDETCRALFERLDGLEQTLAQILRSDETRAEFELLRTTAMLLARAADEQEVLDAILDGLMSAIPYNAAGIFLTRDDPETHIREIRAQVTRGYPVLREDRFRQKVDEGILGWVITNGRAEIVDDVRLDPRYISAREETRSEISVPIFSKGEVIGAINLESDQIGAFAIASQHLLENLASYAAISLDRTKINRELIEAQAAERELEIAHDIQRNLLPRGAPEFEGYDIAGLNVPSTSVGGDYFDFLSLTQSDLGIVIADVAGKGVPAGLVMSGLRAALRARVETVYSIRNVMAELNKFLHASTGAERFVTAFYGVLNRLTGRFTYVNAGHNPPLLLHADGRAVKLQTGGPLLGVLEDAAYFEANADLEPGAILVMYTDGIVEAGGEEGEEFGDQRVELLVRQRAGESARVIAETIEREAKKYHRNHGDLDDRTVIVVKHL